ncbi:hypothetical protein [Novosphingopyxis sp. YJ-S2-01]|uniref:hypothetical protein n=1 Tax=Novosphingopyxis sp. YJ-S2-01 TaxID=2794021 RepID=UPI0018DC2439|nr:hypothetical protein [Novosphingopyxis sp. YJ-S2-01]MBH9537495.1 hypothetical protein [Novosphingopyxis sp. YJ-S2-01]
MTDLRKLTDAELEREIERAQRECDENHCRGFTGMMTGFDLFEAVAERQERARRRALTNPI